MSEHEENPEDKKSGKGAVRNFVDDGKPGSEFETREMPAVEDDDDEPESIHRVVVDNAKPGSTADTIVAGKEETEARRKSGNKEADFTPAKEEEEDEDATAMIQPGKPDPFDDLDTREVPALTDEWRERAADVASRLGETAEVVGEWEGEGDESLAASVAAASGEIPLPTEDEPAEIAGPIMQGARLAQAAWASLRFEQRLEFFDRLRNELVTQRADYVPSMATAIGRPMVEALTGEYLPVLEALRTLEDIVPPLLAGHHAPTPPVTHDGVSAEVRMAPYGVVLIANGRFSPFASPMTLMIDALATGNAVLFCGSEHHPRVNEMIRRLFQRAGFPDNLVQLLGGDSDTIGTLIEVKPDKVFFEGDEDRAARVASRCAQSGCALALLRKVKNIMVVLKDADLERAVAAALSAAFGTGGMRQGAVERIVVQEAVYDEFRMKFIEAIRTMNSHHAQLANIQDAFNPRRAQMLIEDAVAKGALVTHPAGEEPGRWIHWKAAVFESLPPKAMLSTQQFEGPGCALYRTSSPVEETARILGQLPASNISVLGPLDRATRAKFEQLPASRVSFNDPLLLGGSAQGGAPLGPETPRTAAGPHAMLRPKVVVSGEDHGRRVAWFPYTDDKAYALMDAIEAIYGARTGKRIKAQLKIAINPSVRKLLRGED